MADITITNKAARLFLIRTKAGVLRINPLATETVKPEQAAEVAAAIKGPLRSHVASGALVVTGLELTAAAPNPAASSTPPSAPEAAPPPPPTPTAPAAVSGDTEPVVSATSTTTTTAAKRGK